MSSREGEIVDRRRFTPDGNVNPDYKKREDAQGGETKAEASNSREGFEKQAVVIGLMRKINELGREISGLEGRISAMAAEFYALFDSLTPEEQHAIRERVNAESPREKDRIGFLGGKKGQNEGFREAHISGFTQGH